MKDKNLTDEQIRRKIKNGNRKKAYFITLITTCVVVLAAIIPIIIINSTGKNKTTPPNPNETYYTITMPTNNVGKYVIEDQTIIVDKSKVKPNTEYRFKVILDESTNQSKIKVKANGTLLVPDANGIYTVAIKKNTTIAVENVAKNSYILQEVSGQIKVKKNGEEINQGNVIYHDDILTVEYEFKPLYDQIISVTCAEKQGTTNNYKVTGNVTINFSENKKVATIDKLQFQYKNGHYEVTPIDNTISGEVVIPGTYNDNTHEEQSVVIPDNAFDECQSITSFVILDGVTNIGENILTYKQVALVVIPESVTSMGRSGLYSSFNVGGSVYYIGTTNSWLDNNLSQGISGYYNLITSDGLVTEATFNSDIGSYTLQYVKSLNKITIGDGVSSISNYAFRGCENLTTVVYNGTTQSWVSRKLGRYLPTYYDLTTSSGLVTEYTFTNAVPEYAFQNVKSLEHVTFESGVTKIGEYAFAGTNLSGEVILPDNLTTIGNRAFSECKNISLITLGRGLSSVGYSTFEGCRGIIEIVNKSSSMELVLGDDSCGGVAAHASRIITDESQKGTFEDIEGIKYFKYNEDGQTYILAVNSIDLDCSEIKLHKDTTGIRPYAFNGCVNLKTIGELPDKLTYIGENAFYNCTNLTGDLVIPSSVTSIGNNAFYNCSNLTGDVILPNNVISLGKEAFYNCSKIKSIVLGDNITVIHKSTFSNCTGLKSIVLGNGVTTISKSAFDGCISLESIEIGSAVYEIAKSVFDGCVSLKSVTIDSPDIYKNLKDLTSAGNILTNISSGETIRVLKTIVDDEVSNPIPDYIKSNFDKTDDPENSMYYLFIKK